jgi:hypothetical protein
MVEDAVYILFCNLRHIDIIVKGVQGALEIMGRYGPLVAKP